MCIRDSICTEYDCCGISDPGKSGNDLISVFIAVISRHLQGSSHCFVIINRFIFVHIDSSHCPVSYTHLDVYKRQQWDRFTSNSTPLSGSQGLLFLGFENIPDGIRTGIQIDEKNSVSQWEPFESAEESSAQSACVTRQLEQPADISPEKEIPVILQSLDSGGTIETLDLDFFHDPSRAEGYGYDRVFCITVSFSQTPLR